MRVQFASCFDGTEFRGAGTLDFSDGRITAVAFDGAGEGSPDLRVGFLMPALQDAMGCVFGYREGFPYRDALGPVLGCASEYAAGGVGYLVDPTQPLSTIRSIRRLVPGGPTIRAAGGIFEQLPASSPATRAVDSTASLAAEVSIAVREGAGALAAGRYLSADLAEQLRCAARSHGLVYIAQWSDQPRLPAVEAVSVSPLLSAFGMDDWSSLPEILGKVTTTTGATTLRSWLSAALDAGTVVVPEVAALARRMVLGDVVSDIACIDSCGFLPYAEHLVRMRGPVGLAYGRKKLLERTWVAPGSSHERRLTDSALAVLVELLGEFMSAGGCCALGSGYPEFGIFPRTGLGSEAAYLMQFGMSLDQTLRACCGLLEVDDSGRVRLCQREIGEDQPALFAVADAAVTDRWPWDARLWRTDLSSPVPDQPTQGLVSR